MNKSNINELSAETEADSNSTAQNRHVSQPNANTNVIGSQVFSMSLNDTILELSVKAKEGNMELWLNFIMKCIENVVGFYEWFNNAHKEEEYPIVVKTENGFSIDLSQIRKVFVKMRGYEIKDRRDAI